MKVLPFSKERYKEVAKIHNGKLKHLLHQNHWAYFIQTLQKGFLGEEDSSLFKLYNSENTLIFF